jgi:hypothetical protein
MLLRANALSGCEFRCECNLDSSAGTPSARRDGLFDTEGTPSMRRNGQRKGVMVATSKPAAFNRSPYSRGRAFAATRCDRHADVEQLDCGWGVAWWYDPLDREEPGVRRYGTPAVTRSTGASISSRSCITLLRIQRSPPVDTALTKSPQRNVARVARPSLSS